MNLLTAKDDLKKSIINYLDNALPVKDWMDADVRQEFERFQNEEMDFVKDPYVESSNAYKTSDQTLEEIGLEPEVACTFAKYVLDNPDATNADFKPFLHQARAFEAVTKENKNLVVCTGTGSGKTECFLLPVINEIYKQHKKAKGENGAYDRHVRALILYPMNALVTD